MAKGLTNMTIASAEPIAGEQIDLNDMGCPGLSLRIGMKKKTWSFAYRNDDGKKRRFTIGSP